MSLTCLLLATTLVPSATDQRINLADFGRVVKFVGDTPTTMEADEIESGSDGWPVWKGEDDESMMGLEWDEPRDVAEVEIEFRHAIAGRDLIRVQYFLNESPATQPDSGPVTPDTFHGRWVTAETEWWAGDRFVGFSFVPMSEELPGKGMPEVTWRRTCRLRFLLGKRKEDLPAVRYLRVYGPAEAVEANFEVRLDKAGPLAAPLELRMVNGLVIAQDGEDAESGVIESDRERVRLRFGKKDLSGASRTIATLVGGRGDRKGFSFLPAEVVERGIIRVPSLGASIVHVGSQVDYSESTGSGPSPADRSETRPSPTFESVARETIGGSVVRQAFRTPELEKRAERRYRPVLEAAMSVDLPEPILNEFYRAEVVRLAAAADGKRGDEPISAAAYAEFSQPVAGCQEARALDVVGIPGAAEAFLNACLTLKPSLVPAGRFGKKVKGFLGVPAGPREVRDRSVLEHGVLLGLVAEHYRLTRDRRWLNSHSSRLIQACDFIITQSQAESPTHLWDTDEPTDGLLPAGPIPGTTAWGRWLAANAYAARGFREVAEALGDINDPDASRLLRSAEAFEREVARASRLAMIESPVVRLADGYHSPMQPIRVGFRGREPDPVLEAVQGAVHLVASGVYDSDALETGWILRDAEDNVLPGVGMSHPEKPESVAVRSRYVRECSRSPAGPPPLVPACLDAGRYRDAWRSFYGLLAAELARRSADHTESGLRASGNGAVLLVWLREMLVRQRGVELELLAGVPPEWFARGRKLSVHRVPTGFGPLDLSVDSQADGNRITARLRGPERDRPPSVRLWIRASRPLIGVTVNGERMVTFSAHTGLIRLPATSGETVIVATY